MHAIGCGFLNPQCLAGNYSFSAISSSFFMGDRKNIQREKPKGPQAKKKKTDGETTSQDMEDFSTIQVRNIRKALISWYYENQRDLPWRINQQEETEEDEIRAYAVWVSEVMLQQTRVSTVIEYYKRWMNKWPTVNCLARATQEEVNEMWAGLGYYRRARFLLEGAKSVVAGGEFPKTACALRAVRGVGDYTAGAIASIAFKEAVPAVDGNVIRVIARLKAISANPKKNQTIKYFWKLAGQLVDPSRPGDFNQALMELGATVCTSTNPTCVLCPISNQCQAFAISKKYKAEKVTDYPIKVAKIKQRQEFAAVCVVEIKKCSEESMFLLTKRPNEGLLAGLWEFPLVLVNEKETETSKRRKAMDEYLKKSLNLDLAKDCHVVSRENVGEYLHIFSHIRLMMYVELLILVLKDGVTTVDSINEEDSIPWKYVDKRTVESMGLTSGVRKVYNMIQSFKQKQGLMISKRHQDTNLGKTKFMFTT